MNAQKRVVIFMFYTNIVKLCEERGISVSALLDKLDMSKSAVTRWKSGSSPNNYAKRKIALTGGFSAYQC
jgi:transcriptional regulator with XRE-family HTH domain